MYLNIGYICSLEVEDSENSQDPQDKDSSLRPLLSLESIKYLGCLETIKMIWKALMILRIFLTYLYKSEKGSVYKSWRRSIQKILLQDVLNTETGSFWVE